jgi:enamine deaminase RidA (YjgF/YER057c/UK114 family)
MRDPLNIGAFGARQGAFSDAVWAPRDGRQLFISGLTSRNVDRTVFGVGDPAAQMRRVLDRMGELLAEAGGTLDDIAQVRVLVRDMEHWREMQPLFDSAWGAAWPACTLYEINRLYDEELLVEVEATAVIPQEEGTAP